MDYKQIVDILENQPYYVKNGNQTLILKKPVVVKTFDSNNISLSILRINEDRKVYTDTPQFQWQTYQFTKQYRIHKIEGKLYCNDNRYYDYECQYLNQDQQWISIIKQQGVHKDLSIEFKPKLWALGIRFQGINTRNNIFHLNKLNIFAEVGLPEAQEGVKESLLHIPLNYDKRQLLIYLKDKFFIKRQIIIIWVLNNMLQKFLMNPNGLFKIQLMMIKKIYTVVIGQPLNFQENLKQNQLQLLLLMERQPITMNYNYQINRKNGQRWNK